MRAVVAVLCVVAGTIGSVLAARAVGRSDAAKARLAFHLSSASIASTLKLALQHDEDLTISANTFFADDPNASRVDFKTWATREQAPRRFPELERLGFVALVKAQEPAAFEARTTGQAVTSLGGRSVSTGAEGVRVAARAAQRPYYCVTVAKLVRGPVEYPPVGVSRCALTSPLLLSRASGQSNYALVSARREQALGVETPVYSGGATPSTVARREQLFAGWLRVVLAPGVVLQQALTGHPDNAVRLRHRSGSSDVLFTGGTSQQRAQRATINLDDGWSVETFGPPATAGVLADGHALRF